MNPQELVDGYKRGEIALQDAVDQFGKGLNQLLVEAATPLTPQEFADQMREICNSGDEEALHVSADNLLTDVLTSLGYGDGVAIFNRTPKWYA